VVATNGADRGFAAIGKRRLFGKGKPVEVVMAPRSGAGLRPAIGHGAAPAHRSGAIRSFFAWT